MSKSDFDFNIFYGDEETVFAVNKNLFTKQQADTMFIRETELPLERAKTSTGYVYYGFGVADGERINGYWFSKEPNGRHPIECFAYIW